MTYLVLLSFCLYLCNSILNPNLYKDASQPINTRVQNLLSQMTTKEKIWQLLSFDINPTTYENGIGRIKGKGSTPESYISFRNNAQKQTINGSRLNIPASFHEESLHSSIPGGTVFPTPISQGCTWNTTLISEIASIIAYESRTVGTDVVYNPVINLWTDARFGRTSEGFSANPTLTSFYARAVIKGLQNDNNSGSFSYLPNNTRNVISLAKHYAAYGAAIGGLNAAPSDISKRTMFEIYLKPWMAYSNAGGRGAMASHQTIDRVPMHANGFYINDVLRYNKLFNFGEGAIVSDCNDIGVLQSYRIAANKSQAAARAIIAGVDLDLVCGDPDTDSIAGSYIQLQSAIDDGMVNITTINTATSRVLAGKFAAGLFDDYTYVNDTDAWKKILNNDYHIQVAYDAALQGLNLLKVNTKKFPDDYSLKTIYNNNGLKNLALIGPLINASAEDYLGPYTQYTAGTINVPTILQTFTDEYSNNINIKYAQGTQIQTTNTNGFTQAINIAKESDVVIVGLGDALNTCGEWNDNDNLDPPGNQLELLEAVVNAINGTNIILVVVLINGRQYTFGEGNRILNDVDLLYAAFRPGQMGCVAIRDAIMGVKENSGRLGQAWPKYVGDVNSGSAPFLQTIRGKWVANHRSTPDPDGRVYDSYQNEQTLLNEITDPLFEFGYGLSNSGCLDSVKYSDLKVVKIDNNSTYIMKVSLTVVNGCKRDVTDVVQVYLVDPPMLSMKNRILVRFWKRLIGMNKMFLKAGESRNVDIDVRFDDVAIFIDDTYEKMEVISGKYTVRVGQSSRTDSLSVDIQL